MSETCDSSIRPSELLSGVSIVKLLEGDECKLHRRTPYAITDVSQTQFSIARYYGSIKFNGEFYIYRPDLDELIRDDVLAWAIKRQRERLTNTAPDQ